MSLLRDDRDNYIFGGIARQAGKFLPGSLRGFAKHLSKLSEVGEYANIYQTTNRRYSSPLNNTRELLRRKKPKYESDAYFLLAESEKRKKDIETPVEVNKYFKELEKDYLKKFPKDFHTDVKEALKQAKQLDLDAIKEDKLAFKEDQKRIRKLINDLKGKEKNRKGKNMGGILEDDREQYVIGGLAKTASNALKKFFSKSSKENFSIKKLVEDYDKLSTKQAQKKFDKNVADIKGKDFDMFMVNEVNLSADERAFVKEQYPDFTGNTAADVYRHTKSEKVVDDMYTNNQRLALYEEQFSDIMPDDKYTPLEEIDIPEEFDDDIPFATGGLLVDDREKFIIGGAVSGIKKGITNLINKVKKSASQRRTKKQDSKAIVELRTTLEEFDAYDAALQRKIAEDPVNTDYTEQLELLEEARFYVESELKQRSRAQVAQGGSLLKDDMATMEEDMPMEETHQMPDGTVMPGATHEESEMMMESVEPEMAPDETMLPDEAMEDDFIDFILDEALSEEEEDMLMSKLEQDDQLSVLFDKVIDVAQEFAGSGPVEGPGSGVSDSIPARLSDGEFVFTAKSVEEIGADNLMAMMKDAEMKAEERQGLAEGGMPEEEETVTMEVQEQKEPKVQIAKATVNNTRGLLDEDEISKGIKSKMMLDPLQRHVRS